MDKVQVFKVFESIGVGRVSIQVLNGEKQTLDLYATDNQLEELRILLNAMRPKQGYLK